MRKLCEMNECFANSRVSFSSFFAVSMFHTAEFFIKSNRHVPRPAYVTHRHVCCKHRNNFLLLWYCSILTIFLRSIFFFSIHPLSAQSLFFHSVYFLFAIFFAQLQHFHHLCTYSIPIFHYVNLLPTTFLTYGVRGASTSSLGVSNNERKISEILHILHNARHDLTFVFATTLYASCHAIHSQQIDD